MWAWPGKKLLFMGCEFAQSHEWRHDTSLDWHLTQYPDHEGVRLLVRDLNKLYASEPGLSATDFNPSGFRWLSCHDADANLVSYLRNSADERTMFAIVGHFGGATRDYRIGVPRQGYWREVLNSNSEYYGGTGKGNDGGRSTEELARDGFGQSINVTLPPLTTTIFKWQAEG